MRSMCGEVGICDFAEVLKTKLKHHLWIFIHQKTQYLVLILSYHRGNERAPRTRAPLEKHPDTMRGALTSKNAVCVPCALRQGANDDVV